jgi:hypothetical protein
MAETMPARAAMARHPSGLSDPSSSLLARNHRSFRKVFAYSGSDRRCVVDAMCVSLFFFSTSVHWMVVQCIACLGPIVLIKFASNGLRRSKRTQRCRNDVWARVSKSSNEPNAARLAVTYVSQLRQTNPTPPEWQSPTCADHAERTQRRQDGSHWPHGLSISARTKPARGPMP